MNTEVKVIFLVWLVALHIFFIGLFYAYMAVTGGYGLGSYVETPTPKQKEERTATAQAERHEESAFFDSLILPCTRGSDVDTDPCAPRRHFGFDGVILSSEVYPDEPPTLEEVLLNSYGFYEPRDVPEDLLIGSAHLVVRGSFDVGSTSCAGHPLLFPAWIFGDDTATSSVLGGTVSADGLTFHHWTCFSEFSVHEYLVGRGPAKISIQHPNSGVPYDTDDASSLAAYREEPESVRSQIAKEYEGIEWVAWLGPSYNVLVESLTAYALWDVQKDDDGVVRVVSPDAAYYEDAGVTGWALRRLRYPLTDFRREILGAHVLRDKRTAGRVGVDTDTPMRVTDVFKLSDYYDEVGAYDKPIATPAPPPTRPYAPTGLIVKRWTDPHPEVDLEWYAPPSSEVTSYKILRIDSTGDESQVVATVSADLLEYTDVGLLTTGAEYTYAVIAVNAHGESDPSASVTIRAR